MADYQYRLERPAKLKDLYGTTNLVKFQKSSIKTCPAFDG
jgi:hypothetical protein